MSYNKKNYNKNKAGTKSKVFLIPTFFVAVIPLIMYYHAFNSKLGDYPWYGPDESADVFLYFKMAAVIWIGVIMACFFVYGYLQDKSIKTFIVKNGKPLIPLAVYLLLSIFSTVFSEYAYWGWHGIADQFESLWALLGYGMFVFYAFIFIREISDAKKTLFFISLGAGIVALIGTFQAFSMDFYKTSIGKMTFLPKILRNEPIEFTFEAGRTYTSLYNPNYVGTFVCLLVPVMLVLCLFTKNKIVKAVYGVILLLMLTSLFGARSKSGIMVLFTVLLLMIILYRKKCLHFWKQSLLVILIFTGLFIGYNAWQGNNLIQTLKLSLNPGKAAAPPLSAIETNDDDIRITYNGNVLVFAFHPEGTDLVSQLYLTDEDGNAVASAVDGNGNVVIQDERFAGIAAAFANFNETLAFNLIISGRNHFFTNQAGDNTYYLITSTGKLDKINNAEAASFLVGKENIASRRGFIWSKTIPLLKEYIFLGSGADTFTLVYPNDDYIGKENWGYQNQILSKPHCMYLQIAVQTGVVSLIALLVFYAWYFFASLKLYAKSSFDTQEEQIGAAILAGSFAYMVMGISNDSTITVAPVFWLLMGIGIAINIQVKKANMENK